MIIHPVYFPPVLSYSLMITSGELLFEVMDYYEKQTYRSRMYIHATNGKQLLSVQVKHTQSDGKQLYKDVRISNDFNWQKQHWRSLETAYRTSPFFEFYEDDLYPLFHQKFDFLIDLNIKTIETVNSLLDINFSYKTTVEYRPEYENIKDFRFLTNAKKQPEIIDKFPSYTQMFSNKNGFLSNLSILDVLFMEGPNTIIYLDKINEVVKKELYVFKS